MPLAKKAHSSAASERFRFAEEFQTEQDPEAGRTRTEAHLQRLVHELKERRIELESQNEELRQAGEKLQAEKEKYSELYDSAPVAYMTLDREGSIRDANLTCAGLLGIERSRLIKRRFAPFVSAAHRPAFYGFLRKVFESAARECCEVTLLKNGNVPVDVRIEAVVAASGWECRAAMTDITEHNRAEADRLVLRKLESTGVLAGGIAHDFNNLLTVILMNLELLRVNVSSGQEAAARLEEAKKAVLLAHDLTEQLISFAEGGAPVRKTTALSAVIRDAVRPALSGSGVRCEFTLADDLWMAEMDAGQIGQVIRKMVRNAREATPEGGVVTVRAENRVVESHDDPALPPGDYVQLSIRDRGVGIRQELLPKIFDPYFSTKQRDNRKGVGLDLTICHTIIRNHGGAISVRSEAGVGTTFDILLPASRKSIAPENAPRPNFPSERPLPRGFLRW